MTDKQKILISPCIVPEHGERDIIILRHDVGVQWADGTNEQRNIDLVVYGDPNRYSAMAATVGFPTGIAARMVLDGKIQFRRVSFSCTLCVWLSESLQSRRVHMHVLSMVV